MSVKPKRTTSRQRSGYGVALLAIAVAGWWAWTAAIVDGAQRVRLPTNTQSQCKLHYSHFHVLWTLPPLVALYALLRPFLTRLDRSKLVAIPCIAFVWTTPWDNELVRQGAWWYPAACVIGRVGYVPLEEYAFFILQSLVTSLLCIGVTRWTTPRVHARAAPSFSLWLPLVPLITMLGGFAGLYSADEHRYYASMIAWWASIPLILLWYGTRKSWPRTAVSPWLACLVIPTVYLCCADLYAMRRGTWHIAESRSLNIFVVPDLPIEEASFFFVTNVLLISACFTFDRVVWQIRTRRVAATAEDVSPLSPTLFALTWKTIPTIWAAFTTLDDDEIEQDAVGMQSAQLRSLRILRRASKSFHVASLLLPWDLRTDLGYLYAFARTMDDYIDTPHAAESVDNRIDLLKALVSAAFGSNATESNQDVRAKIEGCFTSSSFAADRTARLDLSQSAYAACTLRAIVPEHLWHELLDGYATDNQIGGPRFASFEQQAAYAQDVAGSIGEMCVRVVLARCGVVVDKNLKVRRDLTRAALTQTGALNANDDEKYTLRFDDLATLSAKALTSSDVLRILHDARRMGCSLQLINIARDIVKDARELDRSYLVQSAAERSSPSQLEPSVIFQSKLELVRLARDIFDASGPSINCIPDVASQTGFRVACAVYMAISAAIERDGVKGCMGRSHLSGWERAYVAVKAVYWGIA